MARIHICPCTGQILFATWQIASCIFCCTETVLLQKMLAPQGGRTPSEVGLLIESFRAMIDWRQMPERRIVPLKKSDV
jgi:hypothetical protein